MAEPTGERIFEQVTITGGVNEYCDRGRTALFAAMSEAVLQDPSLKDKSVGEIKEAVLARAAREKLFDIPRDVYETHAAALSGVETAESMLTGVRRYVDNLAGVIAAAIKAGEQLV